MMQGVTPTHIVPFGIFCRICQNSIQYFIPCKDIPPIVQSWLCHHNAIDSAPVIGNKGKPKVFVFLCGSPQVTAHLPSEPLPILSCGAFRPDRLQAFRSRYTARLQCHLLGMAESDRHKAHQCTQSLTGYYLPSCSCIRESRSLRGVHLVTGVYTST